MVVAMVVFVHLLPAELCCVCSSCKISC